MKTETQFRTLNEVLLFRSANQPDETAYTFLADKDGQSLSLTYKELDQKCKILAATLQEDINPGDRILLLYPPCLEYIVAFFGCLYAGAIPVPAYPPDQKSFTRLQGIVEDAGAKIALSLDSTINKIFKGSLSDAQNLSTRINDEESRIIWLSTERLSNDGLENWKNPEPKPESVAFLQYTSGSTGKPKGVVISHENLVYNSELIRVCCDHKPGDCIVSWLPPYHDMGLIGAIIQSIYAGIPCVLMSPMTFLKRPFKWLKSISDLNIEGKVTSGAPNFAFDLCMEKITPEQRKELDLSKWKIAYNGAEPVRADTLERFAGLFAVSGFKKEYFYPVYGLAEGTLMASAGDYKAMPAIRHFNTKAIENNKVLPVQPRDHDAYILTACGKSLPGQEILIVNPKTLEPCRDDEVGEVWLSGPSVAQGYWRKVSDTQQNFCAYPLNSLNGPYLRTGDLGFLYEGELFITGRLKDMIIIRGVNHYPQDIEDSMAGSNPCLRQGFGAALSVSVHGEERLVLIQEVKRLFAGNLDASEVLADIRKGVSLQHQVQPFAIVLIEPSSFPKTSSGKLQRSVAKRMYQEHSLKVIARWEKELEIEEILMSES